MFFDSQIFSTAQLSQLLQVSESTVKRWADSGALRCFKTPGGHRKFRLHDVLEFLDNNGFETLGFLVRPKEEFEDYRAHWQITRGDWKGLSQVCQKMLLNGDREKMFVLMSNCVTRQVPLAKVFDMVVMPAMKRIIDAWENGDLRVYEERKATLTLTQVVSHLTQVLHKKVKGTGVAVVACPEGEHHFLPVAIAALLLEEQGWTVVNMGPDTPWRALQEGLEGITPQLAIYAVTTPSMDPGVFAQGARSFSDFAHNLGCKVAVCGQAAPENDVASLGCDLVTRSYETLLEFAGALRESILLQRKGRRRATVS